jgi:hypothetical protein
MCEIDRIINQMRRDKFTPEQKQRMAEANIKWRRANPEQVRRIHGDYYLKHRESILAKAKARREKRKVAA